MHTRVYLQICNTFRCVCVCVCDMRDCFTLVYVSIQGNKRFLVLFVCLFVCLFVRFRVTSSPVLCVPFRCTQATG